MSLAAPMQRKWDGVEVVPCEVGCGVRGGLASTVFVVVVGAGALGGIEYRSLPVNADAALRMLDGPCCRYES